MTAPETAPGARDQLPDATSVAARHPDLPGLAVLLDRHRLAAVLAPLVGERAAASAHVQRLRLKPATSVTAAVRVVSPTTLLRGGSADAEPSCTWWRVRGLVEQSWDAKGRNEVRRASRLYLPSLSRDDLRTTVVPVEAERHLPDLHRMRADTGSLVEIAGETRWTRTLSYNPDRRWVGAAFDASGHPRELLRWQAHAKAPAILPWTPGRPWAEADGATLAADLAAEVARELTKREAAEFGAAERPLRLREVAGFLGALDARWGKRGRRLADLLERSLADVPLAPAHGDLTPDQVVVDEGRVHVLDWDRVGLYPVGWDAATWAVGRLLAGGAPPNQSAQRQARATGGPAAGTQLPAATRAAAHLAYAPDPFRRQLPHWAALTERLLHTAEDILEER